jgi:UDP-N-acetyl-D-mannosaminuronic acid transferase (WecB/TagA/CpsF family)
MSANYVGDGNDDGTIFGRSSGKIGFYGTTPVTQQTLSAAVATTAAVTTTNGWLYTTSEQANAIVALVNDMRAELVEVGLFA